MLEKMQKRTKVPSLQIVDYWKERSKLMKSNKIERKGQEKSGNKGEIP